MNSNIVFPHNRTIPYSYELPMCVVAKSRWICNVTVDFELCTFSSKKMHYEWETNQETSCCNLE
jgi:hypothetical protein